MRQSSESKAPYSRERASQRLKVISFIHSVASGIATSNWRCIHKFIQIVRLLRGILHTITQSCCSGDHLLGAALRVPEPASASINCYQRKRLDFSILRPSTRTTQKHAQMITSSKGKPVTLDFCTRHTNPELIEFEQNHSE